MRSEKIAALDQYLENRMQACRKHAAMLTEEVRTDESVLGVVQENIYDIFRTILAVAEEKCGGDEAKFCEFFQSNTLQIPGNWQASLQNARAQNDVEMAHLERIKLETVNEIRTEFARIWEIEG